jgi:hypothetical protein
MRFPYFFNKWEVNKYIPVLKKRINFPKLPVIGQAVNPLKIPLTQRYGLPVQDDKYGMLCMHAGSALVQELYLVARAATSGFLPATGPVAHVIDRVGQWTGLIVGALPWMFCDGVDPKQVLSDFVDNFPGGSVGLANALKGMKKFPILNKIFADKDLKNLQKSYPSMLPMKPFDESRNGNDFMQVWGSARGSSGAGAGAVTGVAIAGWQSAPVSPNAGADADDFAQAEFYFDCGNPAAGSDETVLVPNVYPPALGYTDDGAGGKDAGSWLECKYNAMWNMRWKARMRRYHQMEWDLRKDIELSLYQGLGFDSVVKQILTPIFADSSLGKVTVLDPIKDCVTSLGAGTSSQSGDFGKCWLPVGSFFSLPNGGKVGLGSSTPDGYPMIDVLH